jgi:hypothetical protein
MGDARWLGSMPRAEAAKWHHGSPRRRSPGRGRRGRGIGLGTHHVSCGAAVADIEVNTRTGNIVATRLFGAPTLGSSSTGAGREPDHRADDPGHQPYLKEEVTSTRPASRASTGCHIQRCALPSIRT